ncbi:hypothetical protein [Clostridium tagluense]|uniref:hypothetical protein n=1 Tax=Clostridium tagluense TaxID=360422 RepID=UPI001CF48F3F|nr:hypothetical protein [Clostridium tagluense]MCB2300827.1 hypothetical protein [Clostridium tagluense]
MSYDGDYLTLENASNLTFLHDDIVQYIHDTLIWIPSINPAMNYERGLGLNNYGITLFDKEGAEVILKIAKAWADLFTYGPSTLNLTGSYGWITDDNGILDGDYERFNINRDELVNRFRKLQLFSEKVISNKYFILHHGI